MVFRSPTQGIGVIVLAILTVCGLAGLLILPILGRTQSPLSQARTLASSDRYAEAEEAYLDLARQRPASLPVLIELVDNDLGWRLHLLRSAADPELSNDPSRTPEAFAARVEAAVAAPDLPPDVALLARWWRGVVLRQPNEIDRAAVVAAADGDPPVPWANHLLARAALHTDAEDDAAGRFAREATFFDDRARDAGEACSLWLEDGDWDRLAAALQVPRFARQVGADVRFEMALRQSDWRSAARWFFPSQYQGATLGIWLLAAVSGLVWFGLCALIGHVRERPRVRLPLYVGAFVLGVASTYVTVAVSIAEERLLKFAEKGVAVLDAIYFVVGVGLREELSKALLFLPLVPILRRWGRRREALACGALVGLGFAAEENLGYLRMGLSTALARFLTANFLHLSTTGLVAVAIDDAVRGRETREGDLSRTLMLVVVAHGLYDFFLSSSDVGGGSFLSMFVFILLTRRFVDVLRQLPGREAPLARWFLMGLALVVGASFVYASSLVGPGPAAAALFEGGIGVAIVAYVFARELESV
jgi:RsiW-degrading membrane proteinase PrsW (M82 family)